MLKVSPTILPIIPGLILIPISIHFISGIHSGGLSIVWEFVRSSFTPSLDPIIINSSFQSLLVTLKIAYIGWLISIIFGTFLGIISSEMIANIFSYPSKISSFLRNIFSIPRAMHELIWGLILQTIFGISPLIAIISISIPYSFLFSKVVSDQIDTLDKRELRAIINVGSLPLQTLFTFLIPKFKSILINFGSYRLECAIRGATLLGIFGLGGIGIDLQLTLKSLQFKEMWTSLWMLGLTIIIIEKLIDKFKRSLNNNKITIYSYLTISILFLFLFIFSVHSLIIPNLNLIYAANINNLNIPNINEFILGITSLKWSQLITNTLILTFFAACIAISGPPIIMCIYQNRFWTFILSLIWLLQRLFSPPLIAIILLMVSNPSISLAALALGIHNMGIMGRCLKEGIENQSKNEYQALISSGINRQLAWLYGLLSKQSISYLSYASYRTDVILRETTVVGVVGGAGLGWQLQESLSSFAWAEMMLIIMTYIIIALIGESLSNKIRIFWLRQAEDYSQINY